MLEKESTGMGISAKQRHDVIEQTVEEAFKCGVSLRFQKETERIKVEAEILGEDRRAPSIHRGLRRPLNRQSRSEHPA